MGHASPRRNKRDAILRQWEGGGTPAPSLTTSWSLTLVNTSAGSRGSRLSALFLWTSSSMSQAEPQPKQTAAITGCDLIGRSSVRTTALSMQYVSAEVQLLASGPRRLACDFEVYWTFPTGSPVALSQTRDGADINLPDR